METRWHCPVCGCPGRHYNETRMTIVCDQCGHSADDETSAESRRSFDRAVAFAKEHLRVGNFTECKNLIKPFCYDNPNNAKLYLLLLAAETKGYSDYFMDDDNSRHAARDYWDKLERLRSVNTVMRDYAREANAKKIARIRGKRTALFLLFPLVFIAVMLSISVLESAFLAVVAFIVGAIIACDNADKNRKYWKTKIPDNPRNPFWD